MADRLRRRPAAEPFEGNLAVLLGDGRPWAPSWAVSRRDAPSSTRQTRRPWRPAWAKSSGTLPARWFGGRQIRPTAQNGPDGAKSGGPATAKRRKMRPSPLPHRNRPLSRKPYLPISPQPGTWLLDAPEPDSERVSVPDHRPPFSAMEWCQLCRPAWPVAVAVAKRNAVPELASIDRQTRQPKETLNTMVWWRTPDLGPAAAYPQNETMRTRL